MPRPLDVTVNRAMAAPPERVRAVMFDPLQDPRWMAAVRAVEPLGAAAGGAARVRRTGRFLGRTIRWTTEVIAVQPNEVELRIVDGPMRGTVTYRVDAHDSGSLVTIRNTGEAPSLAPRWLLAIAMRRALDADLRRLQRVVENRA